jgi:hypothetical protein
MFLLILFLADLSLPAVLVAVSQGESICDLKSTQDLAIISLSIFVSTSDIGPIGTVGANCLIAFGSSVSYTSPIPKDNSSSSNSAFLSFNISHIAD